MEKERLILFDMDGTLTRGDTFTGFMRHALGTRGLLGVLLRSAGAILLWKLGCRSNVYAKKRMWAEAFRGMPIARYREACSSYADKIERMARREIVERLEEELERGARVIIVSASMEDWISPWARRHGVTDVVATRVENCPQGMLTGGFATPNCEKTEKVRRLLHYLPSLEAERARFHVEAYGDSAGDAEMLEFADVPHLLK